MKQVVALRVPQRTIRTIKNFAGIEILCSIPQVNCAIILAAKAVQVLLITDTISMRIPLLGETIAQ